MTPAELRYQFPATGRAILLNYAGVSPIATSVSTAVSALAQQLVDGPNAAQTYAGFHRQQEALRAKLGRLAGASPKSVALVRNTSHGLTIAAQAIAFEAGDNVVAMQTDYPANIYPWQAQAWRGVATRLVQPDEASLMAACDPRTRTMAVSWVHWGTGRRLDLHRLGSFCRERGILFVVDIVQGFGVLRLNLADLPVDLAAAGCHKGLMAPAGVGMLYVAPHVLPQLLPTNVGWNSVERPIDWDRYHFDELRQSAARFEEGSPSLLAIAALNASLDLLEAVGGQIIEETVLGLASHARDALSAKGLHVTGAHAESGIVGFRHRRDDNETVLNRLEAGGVVCAVRAGYVRFASHVITTRDEIDRAATLAARD